MNLERKRNLCLVFSFPLCSGFPLSRVLVADGSKQVHQTVRKFLLLFCFPSRSDYHFPNGGPGKLTCVRSPCQLGNDDAFDWRPKNLQHIVIKQTENFSDSLFARNVSVRVCYKTFVHGHEKPSPPHFYTEGNFCFIIPNFSCAGKQVMHFFFSGHTTKQLGCTKK